MTRKKRPSLQSLLDRIDELESQLSSEIEVAQDMSSTDRAKAANQLRHVDWCLTQCWNHIELGKAGYLGQALGAVKVLIDMVEAP